jgi:hypothetical protein
MFKNRLLFSYGEGVEGASDVELVWGRQRFLWRFIWKVAYRNIRPEEQ